MTDLTQHIRQTPLVDSHEHLITEADYLGRPPDVLQMLLDGYITADLAVAGADPKALERLTVPSSGDVATRFADVRDAWERCRFTGYGEAVRLNASQAFGVEELTPETLAAAQAELADEHRAGERRQLLVKRGNIDHVQIDDFTLRCEPDASGPEFFLHDISWEQLANGEVQTDAIRDEVGIDVKDLESLQSAITVVFERNAPCAIAVKSQHAYTRTLAWRPRNNAAAARILDKLLAGKELDENERLCLGDWSLARAVELASEHNLPFKIHTGYHAGHSGMIMDWVRPSHLSPLLKAYPQARFVLMHTGYPYGPELLALAKHYPNTYIDLCWAWAIDPFSTADFIRRFIHTVPSHKLFVFGGDTTWPHIAAAYATQARHWLDRALQAEIDAGDLREPAALELATRFMRDNQYACFDVEGTRAAINAALS